MSTPKKKSAAPKKPVPKKRPAPRKAPAPPVDEFAEDMGVAPLVDLMMQYRELQAMEPDPEDPTAPPEFLCKYGHLVIGDWRYQMRTEFQGLLVDTGPMCPVCLFKHVGHKFRTRQVDRNRKVS
jgi:hypothetical protein